MSQFELLRLKPCLLDGWWLWKTIGSPWKGGSRELEEVAGAGTDDDEEAAGAAEEEAEADAEEELGAVEEPGLGESKRRLAETLGFLRAGEKHMTSSSSWFSALEELSEPKAWENERLSEYCSSSGWSLSSLV